MLFLGVLWFMLVITKLIYFLINVPMICKVGLLASRQDLTVGKLNTCKEPHGSAFTWNSCSREEKHKA